MKGRPTTTMSKHYQVTAVVSRAGCGDELPCWSSLIAQEVVTTVMMMVAVVVEVRP